MIDNFSLNMFCRIKPIEGTLFVYNYPDDMFVFFYEYFCGESKLSSDNQEIMELLDREGIAIESLLEETCIYDDGKTRVYWMDA